MSIYATWLDFGFDENWEDGDETAPPWLYSGSHVLPEQNDARGGQVEVGVIPNHVCAYRAGEENPELDERVLAAHKCGFVRLGVGGDGPFQTVVLDAAHVRELRDMLTTWLDTDIVW